MRWSRTLAQDGAGGGAVGAKQFQREADQIVAARGDMREGEALDDPDAGGEEGAVGFGATGVVWEAANGEIVDAHGLDFVLGEVRGRVGWDVDESFVERAHGPGVIGVAGAEEDSFAGLELVRLELADGNRGGILDGDDAAFAHRGGDGHGVNAGRAVEEMARRVHMGAGVDAGGKLGQVADVAPCDMQGFGPLIGRIARPVDHSVF